MAEEEDDDDYSNEEGLHLSWPPELLHALGPSRKRRRRSKTSACPRGKDFASLLKECNPSSHVIGDARNKARVLDAMPFSEEVVGVNNLDMLRPPSPDFVADMVHDARLGALGAAIHTASPVTVAAASTQLLTSAIELTASNHLRCPSPQ